MDKSTILLAQEVQSLRDRNVLADLVLEVMDAPNLEANIKLEVANWLRMADERIRSMQ